jgi:hypothetical protein
VGPGRGYIQRDGFNFLPAIVRLAELLNGTLKAEKGQSQDFTTPKITRSIE